MRRYFTFIFAPILALLLVISDGRAADAQPTEYQIKAAFLYHFAQFVDWPATAFAQPNSPLIIGVLGDKNPFNGDLARTVDGKILNEHPLIVKEFHSLSEATNNCHILFITASEKKRLPEIFAALNGTSILTVGETPGFTESGGMINFVLEGTKIRFQINETAVKNAELKMSFKLLSLAAHPSH